MVEDTRAQCAFDGTAGDVRVCIVSAYELNGDFVDVGFPVLFVREHRDGDATSDHVRLAQVCHGHAVVPQPFKQVALFFLLSLELNVLNERLGETARLKKAKPFGFVQEDHLKSVSVVEILKCPQFLTRADMDGGDALDLIGLSDDVAAHAVTPA